MSAAAGAVRNFFVTETSERAYCMTMRAAWRHLLSLRSPVLALMSVLAWLVTSPAFAQSGLAFGTVRVLLAVEPVVTVTASGPHSGYVDGDRRFSAPVALAWPVAQVDGRLFVDGVPLGRSLSLRMDNGLLEFDGRRYRGALRLEATTDGIEVVNVLDVESYLRGVVPAEMAAVWPLEALKAQAVAARSYTLTSLDPSARYDLCATDHCQVYRGVAAEHARTDAAIEATAGVVVTYEGTAARTYYHADSGGVLASSAEVWGAWTPYLLARSDTPVDTPHRAWQVRLDGVAVGRELSAAGHDVGAVSSIRVVSLSESGRVRELEVVGERGHRLLSGALLTQQARGWGLKSMIFRVQGGMLVNGDGWGHGVGMSQYGARALANAGFDYGQILAFYYPNTGLTRFLASAR